VGCPYAVRGFDYDYVGILWLNDLVWDGGKWRVNPFAVEERGVMSLVMAARDAAKIKKMDGAATVELLERVKQAYRILFTRALKGVYLWIPDPITRAYLSDSLHQEVKRIGASPASAPTSQQKLIQSEKSDHLAELNTLLTVFETGVAGVMG